MSPEAIPGTAARSQQALSGLIGSWHSWGKRERQVPAAQLSAAVLPENHAKHLRSAAYAPLVNFFLF